jgi:hypothetical protein
MPHNPRLQRHQHLTLRIEIILKQLLIRAARRLPRLGIQRPIKIDRDLVHVMHRPDEELRPRDRQQGAHQGRRRGADPLALEADQDRDGSGVFGAEPQRFGDVGVVPRAQVGDGVACCDLIGFKIKNISCEIPWLVLEKGKGRDDGQTSSG